MKKTPSDYSYRYWAVNTLCKHGLAKTPDEAIAKAEVVCEYIANGQPADISQRQAMDERRSALTLAFDHAKGTDDLDAIMAAAEGFHDYFTGANDVG